MSLILDALRKADAERERGAVPGLHAQPVPPVSLEAPAARTAVPLVWIVAGAAIVLAALLAGFWGLRQPPQGSAAAPAPRPAAAAPSTAATGTAARGPAPVLAEAAPAPAAPSPAAPSPAAPAPAAPAPSAPAPAAPAPAPSVQASSVPPPPAPAPGATVLQSVAEPAPWPSPEARRPGDGAAAPAPAAEARRAAELPPAEAPIHSREQLPDPVRSQLPQLAIGGSIYSTAAADRSLIVNGRIFRENDRLTPELTLEQIRLKSAVFRFKGYRFEVPY